MKKKDYGKLSAIIVHNQSELDEIPLDYKGRIYIQSQFRVVVKK